ncbi:MAG: endolytic transglycosylase MltG [bacterium]
MAKKIKKKKSKLFLLLPILAIFVLLTALYDIYFPKDISGKPKTISIRRGLSAKEIANLLKNEGIIRNKYIFSSLIILKNKEKDIKAGDYEISPSLNMIDILSILTKGNKIKSCFTIPPGYNIYQIADMLYEKGFIDKKRFFNLCFDREFILKLGFSVNTLEGLLFPDTYCVSKGMKEEKIIGIIIERFKKVFKESDVRIAKKMGFSIYQILILASIIEKETSYYKEMPIISAIFHNRLRRNMRLNSCPTVIYSLFPNFDGNLKKEDLEISSPYNTYRHNDLPPSPISNPSISAIKAALNPASTDYLYFVSMNNGRHKFSKTLAEHNIAVSKYQPKIK